MVEDDAALGPFLERALVEASFAVDRARALHDARDFLVQGEYDLISLDLSLPDGSGMEFLRWLRAEGRTMPVLILSSHSDTRRRVEGLDGGADDYLVKPFSLDEYLSRVRALLRRGGGGRQETVHRLGKVTCDPAARRVTVSGAEVSLTPKEFAVLQMFLASPGAVLSRTQIVNSVWRWNFDGFSNVVDVHVSALRRKLRGSGIRFRSVPRVGYLLEEIAGDAEPAEAG